MDNCTHKWYEEYSRKWSFYQIHDHGMQNHHLCRCLKGRRINISRPTLIGTPKIRRHKPAQMIHGDSFCGIRIKDRVDEPG